MKCFSKVTNIVKDNSGETIAEVLVAFILLTIMLLIYAQGIAMAANSEMNAQKSRTGSDKARKQFQDDIATDNTYSLVDQYQVPAYFSSRVKHQEYSYTIDGKEYTYTYYEPILLTDG